jgi:uncharacterized protein YqgV (UPF0045/DUF77 family)
MIVEIQCIPTPPGTDARRYAHVEAAIARIQGSGVRYEVGALGTTVEGEPEVLWPLLRDVHAACLDSGAESVITVIKIAETARPDAVMGMDALVADFRER